MDTIQQSFQQLNHIYVNAASLRKNEDCKVADHTTGKIGV